MRDVRLLVSQVLGWLDVGGRVGLGFRRRTSSSVSARITKKSKKRNKGLWIHDQVQMLRDTGRWVGDASNPVDKEIRKAQSAAAAAKW